MTLKQYQTVAEIIEDVRALRPLGGSAYGRNTFYDNNGGGDQVEAGGVEIAPNVCSGNTICP